MRARVLAFCFAALLIGCGTTTDVSTVHGGTSPPGAWRASSTPALQLIAAAGQLQRSETYWYAVATFNRAVDDNAERARAELREQQRQQQARRAPAGDSSDAGKSGPASSAPGARYNGGGGLPCGGDLPPCWVLDRESGYNDGNPYTYDIHAYNASGCGGRGCRGKWQCDPLTCSGTGTEAQQDAEARALWKGGAGCGHWGAC